MMIFMFIWISLDYNFSFSTSFQQPKMKCPIIAYGTQKVLNFHLITLKVFLNTMIEFSCYEKYYLADLSIVFFSFQNADILTRKFLKFFYIIVNFAYTFIKMWKIALVFNYRDIIDNKNNILDILCNLDELNLNKNVNINSLIKLIEKIFSFQW